MCAFIENLWITEKEKIPNQIMKKAYKHTIYVLHKFAEWWQS